MSEIAQRLSALSAQEAASSLEQPRAIGQAEAAGTAARYSPDGRTIWITSVGAAAINPALYGKLPYDMQRDFAPVSLVVDNVELLVVNNDDPAKSAPEFVVRSKAAAQGVSMASTGIGSIPHLAIEQLADGTGAKLVHIPFNGAAPAITNLMGGQVGGFFGDVPGLIGHVKGGKLRAIGIAAPKRHPALPDVPTLEEQGIRGVDTVNWYALFVPARTPRPIVDFLHKQITEITRQPELQASIQESGRPLSMIQP